MSGYKRGEGYVNFVKQQSVCDVKVGNTASTKLGLCGTLNHLYDKNDH